MPVGAIGLGFSNAMTDYLMKERQRQRDAEDQATDSQMQLIHELANKPNANPALLGQAIHDLADMHNAKANKKLKPGMEGFMGKHEMPMSQFLQGIQDASQGMGSRALEGPTTEPDVEKPSNSNDQAFAALPQNGPMDAQGPPQKAPTSPQDASGAAPGNGPALPTPPIGMPPAGISLSPTSDRMMAAGRQVQNDQAMNPPPPPIPATLAAPQTRDIPANRQPYFKDTATMNAEAGQAAAAKAQGATAGIYDADIEKARAISAETGEDMGQVLARLKGMSRPQQSKNQAVNATVNGEHKTVIVDPVNKTVTDTAGNPIEGDILMDQKTAGGAAGAYNIRTVVGPGGKVTAMWIPKAGPNADGSGVQSAPTGVTAKIPPPPAGTVSLLSPAAVDVAARQMMDTGESTSFGMGGRAEKTAILNRVAELMPGLSLSQQKAAYKGLSGSLAKMQIQSNALNSFENTAKKNLVNFVNAAQQIPDTGSPLFNYPLRKLNRNVLGKEEMAAYDMAASSVLPEFQRIIANPDLKGALTDSARHELAQFNADTATYPMLMAAVNILLKDADNRTSSITEEMDGVKKAIGAMGNSTLKAPPSAVPSAGGGNAQSDNRPKVTNEAMLQKYIEDNAKLGHTISMEDARQTFIDAGYTIEKAPNKSTKPK